MVTKKPLRGFWGLGDSQESHSDKYKTGGNKKNFWFKPGLFGIYSNIMLVVNELSQSFSQSISILVNMSDNLPSSKSVMGLVYQSVSLS